MAEIRHLENWHNVIFFYRGWSDSVKFRETGAEWHVDCGDVVEIETIVEFQYGGRLGEFTFAVIVNKREKFHHNGKHFPNTAATVTRLTSCQQTVHFIYTM